ncbi:MAG: DUF2470 domain-containing protein [Candidatus Nanopelagicales bacterium]
MSSAPRVPGPRDAVSARTVVLGNHHGLAVYGAVLSAPVTYVDDDGEPVLVLPQRSAAAEWVSRTHPLALRVESAEIAVLLHGRPVMVRYEGSTASAIDNHRKCLADHGLRIGTDVLAFARLALSGVLTCAPQAGSLWSGVDLAAYVDARPDTWSLYRDGLLQHVTEEHADDLLLLARREDPTIGVDSCRWLVQATHVDPHGLELRIVGPTGGYAVRVPFTRVVATVDEVEAEIHRLVTTR